MDPVIAPALLAQVSPEALAALPTPRCHTDADGDRSWRLPDGCFHRLDGPAIERADGHRRWYAAGRYHRLDGPAVENPTGYREWWVAGVRHRLNGPAAEDANGTRLWWAAGQRHRIGGPAVELPDGAQQWWVHHQLHRADGPAVAWADGTRAWMWEGDEYHWLLPAALWREGAVRQALWLIGEPDRQRAAALALMPTLAPELQRAAVAEALGDRDAELRLWGLRAAARVELNANAEDARPDGAAAAPSPQPKPRVRLQVIRVGRPGSLRRGIRAGSRAMRLGREFPSR